MYFSDNSNTLNSTTRKLKHKIFLQKLFFILKIPRYSEQPYIQRTWKNLKNAYYPRAPGVRLRPSPQLCAAHKEVTIAVFAHSAKPKIAG